MIYSRLSDLLPSVVPPPERVCYTFDCIDGYLYEPYMPGEDGILWQPFNPNYDPGPMPEPSEKRKEKEAALSSLAQLPMAVAPDPHQRRVRPQVRPSSSQAHQPQPETRASDVPKNTSKQTGRPRNRHWKGRDDRNLDQPREFST